jgi:hypothetical protein
MKMKAKLFACLLFCVGASRGPYAQEAPAGTATHFIIMSAATLRD